MWTAPFSFAGAPETGGLNKKRHGLPFHSLAPKRFVNRSGEPAPEAIRRGLGGRDRSHGAPDFCIECKYRKDGLCRDRHVLILPNAK